MDVATFCGPDLNFVQWGNVPEWFAAIGTVGTLGFVVYAASRDRRRVRLAEERARAIGVSAWAEISPNRGVLRVLVAVVANLTEQPVYDVTVLFGVDVDGVTEALATGHKFLVPPHDAQEVSPDSRDALIDPTTTKFYPIDRLRVSVTFRDAANAKWRRGYDGVLEPVTGKDAPAH